MRIYACLLVCMLYIHVCLARSRFLPCFVASVGLCLMVFEATCLCGQTRPSCHLFGCEQLWEHIPVMLVCLMHTLSPLHAMFCLPFLSCATRLVVFVLCIFACLPTCSCMSPCISFILQSHGTMDTRFKPTFVLPGHPLWFDNMLVCP